MCIYKYVRYYLFLQVDKYIKDSFDIKENTKNERT